MVARAVDRDDVRARRHHLAHHRLAEVGEIAEQLAGLPFLHRLPSRRRGAGGDGRTSTGGRASARGRRCARRTCSAGGGWCRAAAARTSAASARGRSRRTTAAARRARARDPGGRSAAESGARTSARRSMIERTSTGKPARSTPVTRASSAAARIVSVLISRRAGMKRRRGSSRYRPSASSRSVRSA